jgi:hypothetical protein
MPHACQDDGLRAPDYAPQTVRPRLGAPVNLPEYIGLRPRYGGKVHEQ